MADLVPGAMISLVPRVLSPQLKPLYVIDRAAISVGRHPSNDIALPLESVSRFHARLELRGKDIYAVDLGSSNGTYVNRARVTEGVLTDQDEVSFGNIAFVFNYRLQTVAPLPLRDERSESQVRLVSGDDLGLQTVVQKETLAADTTPARDFQSEITDLSSLNRARKLLSILYEFHKQLGYKSEPEEIYQTALDLIFDALPCDRGVILTKAEDEGDLIPVKTKFRSGDAKPDIAISRTIIDRCLKDRVAVLSRDAMTDTRFKRSESILLHDIRSAMCAPLISRNQVQAICFVDTSEAKRAFGEADLAFFASLTAEVATLLDNASMRREMLINQQLAVIGQTITGIAHNIKNILFLTKGGTELMDRCVSEKNFEALERTWGVVRRNLDRVYVMVQDMLEFSRQRVAEKHVANVNRIILDTVEEIREDLDKKRIHLELSLDESAPDMPMDDQGFYRALMNLIVNAS
ncbi:MAG: FHA domain-containing protein, partial [Candidatus Sumerlaeota bacterium]|nr:FHA domain-containing protein [Candidatus Sumerlaeota bacterium]